MALDVVAAVDGDSGSQVRREPTGWFDLFGAVRLADNLDFRARPVVYRRSFNGTWTTQMYELALRYERPGAIGVRLEAGQLSSPVGLSILENRPDKNPVVSPHSTLYLPIPRYEAGTPATFLLAASYPLGARVTVSGAKWDARAAVTDSSPIRGRPFFGDSKPPRMANYMAGAGFTPHIGLRIGGAVAFGPYAAVSEVRNRSRGDRHATLMQIEGEWSFGYTRLAGELLVTKRQLAVNDARVDGGWFEVTQTLTPRVFAAARYDEQWTRWTAAATGDELDAPYRRLETGVGFRVTPDVTLRGTYMTRKGYVVDFWDDQFLASIVFAKKLM
ncbi:MAG TPA: hypothetical protein VJ691_12785 [Vicinamibacterales bacterium]|nr:hypothetical protein [Vicinamibacterales bacterium]